MKDLITVTLVNGVPNAACSEVHKLNPEQVLFIDVRSPEEFKGELGHISGAQLATLGPQLEQFLKEKHLETPMVFVCRSGGRSNQATLFAQSMGFKNVVSMSGGMLEWNARSLPCHCEE